MAMNHLSQNDSEYLSYLRSLSIFVIVFGHVGGFWFYRPYTEFLHVFIPVFFFISGAVGLLSFNRSSSIKGYYYKRIIGLLIPYYLLCLISLIVFVCTCKQLPEFDIGNLLKWIEIRPSPDIMPFPIGQVWFLHTLFFIVLVSPVYFYIQDKYRLALPFIVVAIVGCSGIQLFIDIGFINIMGNNLYRPLVHSGFYIFGFMVFSSTRLQTKTFLISLFAGGIIVSFATAHYLNLNVDYAFHLEAPDLYYVSGSFSAIAALLVFKRRIVALVQLNKLVEKVFRFFHTHTFSIFLLHTFSMYVCEVFFGLVDPKVKTVIYGVVKLGAVLITTCILAVPFTALSVAITSFFNNYDLKRKTAS